MGFDYVQWSQCVEICECRLFREMWFLGMCSLSWFGTGVVVGDVGSSICKLSVPRVFFENVETVGGGGVDGAVIVGGETAVDGDGVTRAGSMIVLC
jgi:hypothetical protein